MGWYFPHGATKKDVVEELSQEWSNENATSSVLKKCVRGNVLWTVRERTLKDGTTLRYIGCDLLQGHREGWGYKPMDESMGPYYYSCPLPYLEMTPVANQKWREEVIKHHAQDQARKTLIRSLKERDTIVLRQGCSPRQLTLVSKKPLRGYGPYGILYKIGIKHIDVEETTKAKNAVQS
jgi:hypothetical protein